MRPALWLASSLALGIAVAEWLRPHPFLALVSVLACAAAAAWERRPRRAAVALLLTVVFLGALRQAWDRTGGRGDLEAWHGQKVALTATVVSEPELRQPTGIGYAAAVAEVDGHPASGKLYVTQRGGETPGYGERILLKGTLKPPTGARTPGGFDRAAYLARQSIYTVADVGAVERQGPGDFSVLRRSAVAARLRLEAVLRATLPPREAALMAGLLFGSRSELPDDIREAFKSSGVFHLLAVSGGNIAMLIVPFLALLHRVGLRRRPAAAAAIPLVVFFVFLTGASPSVLRAGLMAVLVLLGDLLGRERDALNTLGAAALLLLLVAPGLLFDLGFQFSAVATLGILLLARSLEHWLAARLQGVFGQRIGGWLAAGLSVTLAAQVLVEPISLHNFGALSTIAPVANLMVLVFLEPVVQVGSVAVLAGLGFLPAAWVLNWLVRLGLWLLVFLVKATSAVPGAYLQVGQLSGFWMVTWYAVVAIVATPILRNALVARTTVVSQWWVAGSRSRRHLFIAGLLLTLATGYTWNVALADPPDTLYVTFLDVGQGDAIFIRAPGGATALVDAGAYMPPDQARGRVGYDAGAAVILPYLADQGVKRLDYLVLTHADLDHAGGGLTILQEMAVGAVLTSENGATERRFVAAMAAASERQVPVHRPAAGERIDLGGGAVLEVLNPQPTPFSGTRSDDNSNCVAFRLRYRRVAFVLACDLEAVAEEYLVRQGVPLRADVLKAAHHGSGNSSTEAFLAAIRPRWAVLSAGNGNVYGHPHAATLKRLAAIGAEPLRTDRQGSIIMKTDGLEITVTTTRGRPGDDTYRPVGLLGRRLLHAW